MSLQWLRCISQRKYLLRTGAQIDGFGIGTRFAVSLNAPAIEIVYKIVQYRDKGLFKTSPDKQSYPGRKSIIRVKDGNYKKDIVSAFQSNPEDLLRSFKSAEPMQTIRQRLADELSCLDDSIKKIREPQIYPVEFT
jgi:nicotinate phosphoribosyltransferase